MTADKFRELALENAGATEASHMGHADFRIDGRIFASLGYPDDNYGMVKLAPEQQHPLVKKAPKVFAPSAGAWGKSGCTNVYLAAAKAAEIRGALSLASRNLVSKPK